MSKEEEKKGLICRGSDTVLVLIIKEERKKRLRFVLESKPHVKSFLVPFGPDLFNPRKRKRHTRAVEKKKHNPMNPAPHPPRESGLGYSVGKEGSDGRC